MSFFDENWLKSWFLALNPSKTCFSPNFTDLAPIGTRFEAVYAIKMYVLLRIPFKTRIAQHKGIAWAVIRHFYLIEHRIHGNKPGSITIAFLIGYPSTPRPVRGCSLTH